MLFGMYLPNDMYLIWIWWDGLGVNQGKCQNRNDFPILSCRNPKKVSLDYIKQLFLLASYVFSRGS